MNLVVGATGLVGSEICRQLRAHGHKVRALIRTTSDPAKVQALQEAGVETVEGDLKDAASLGSACQGVTAVISTASSTLSRQEGDSIESVDRHGQLELISAAKAAGVERFVFVSFPDNPDNQYPLTESKRAVEKHLMDSGLIYTILQAGYFMEVWLSPALGFDYPNARARIYGSGESKGSWISYRDVAAFAVASLENPASRNAVIKIGGPETLSPLEVVKIFEETSGREFELEYLPEEALREQKAAATDPLQQSFTSLMLQLALGDEIDMRETLRAFPLTLTTVSEYANAVVSAPVRQTVS